jgi:hypothetical protein
MTPGNHLRQSIGVAFLLFLAACYSAYDYIGLPDAAIKYGSRPNPVNPASFLVDARNYFAISGLGSK